MSSAKVKEREPADGPGSCVAVVIGEVGQKFETFDRMLEESRFFETLEAERARSGKDRTDFHITLKPNFMMAVKVDNPALVYTDPELVQHWMTRLHEAGYRTLTVVEAQNVYNLWFRNRSVPNVARVIGMDGEHYRVHDLTDEQEPYEYGEGTLLGDHYVGRTWRDADFRISFAKNKTHDVSHCTLVIKNTYGCLPVLDKYKEYHRKREVDIVTIEALQHFPVHFSAIDAWVSLDGPMGYRESFSVVKDLGDRVVRKGNIHRNRCFIGGQSIVAVERVGMKKMGLDPDKDHRFYGKAHETLGLPDYELIGDDSPYEDWLNVGSVTAQVLDIGEELPVIGHFIGESMGHMDERHFPKRSRARFKKLSNAVARRYMMWRIRRRKGITTMKYDMDDHEQPE